MKVFSKVLYFIDRLGDFLNNSSTRSPIEVYEYTKHLMYRCQDGWPKLCDNLPVVNGICNPVVAGMEDTYLIADDWCIEVEEKINEK